MDIHSYFTAYLCAQDAGTFCAPSFAVGAGKIIERSATQADATAFCTTCTNRILDSIALSTPGSVADYLEAVAGLGCLSQGADPSPRYCFQSTFFQIQNASISLDAAETMMCKDPCTAPVFMKYDRYAALDTNAQSNGVPFGRLFEALCSNDGSSANGGAGQTCLKALGWTPFQSNGSDGGGPPLWNKLVRDCGVSRNGSKFVGPAGACSDPCRASLIALTNAFGCCKESVGSLYESDGVTSIFSTMNSRCGTNLSAPVRCQASSQA